MMRVLIVEDSPTQAEQLRIILEEAALEVEHSTDGRAALALFEHGDFDLIVSDIMMPHMSGYELCHAVKKSPRGRATPVILLSTLADPMDIIRGLECGADNFITKPYEADQLMARIRTVLDNKELRTTGKLTFGVEVSFLGKKFLISSEKEQILDLLISTFEDIVRTNRGLQDSKIALAAAKKEIETYARELELRVEERTAELVERQQQLFQAQKMEAVGQLTGGLAHDFNNLLTVIVGNLDALESILVNQPKAQECAVDALKASLRGAELTKQLLAFSRRQQLQSQIIDLNEVVTGTTSLLRRTLGENIEISAKFSEGLWRAEADPAQVESALLNLAVNARDAMPNGGSLTIETANKILDAQYAADNVEVTPGEYAMLAVTDTGTGIPQSIIDRVFDPFFTTKPVGQGTGLGLSMIYGFAKQSGGHIKIYSEEGHGTTVRLYLPKTKRADFAPVEAHDVDETQLRSRGEVILVVEDNEDVRNVVVRQLSSLGYKTMEAADVADAIEALKNPGQIDLIFTDVVMPGKLNVQDLNRRAAEVRPGLPVLFTSGFSENALPSDLFFDRKNALLSKPYRKQELARKVREALGGS